MLNNFGSLFFILLIGISLIKCKKDKIEVEEDQNKALKKQIAENYAAIAFANYNDALLDAQQLKIAIDAFIATPNEATHMAAKESWLKSRESYGQTEAFRFSDGPIDDDNDLEGVLNAWPLDENFIDYTRDALGAGIINDTVSYPTITEELIAQLNGKGGGEKNISVGYHAIEFLLWGQDDPRTELKTPGNRPFTDFVVGGNVTASNQGRRAEYLEKIGALLIKHLEQVKKQWDPAIVENYRSKFLALQSDVILKNVLTGLGVFSKGELAGERMFVALENKDQEDEHSCFSDNTHRDIYLNALSISNLYFGTYTRTDGVIIKGSAIHDLLLKVAPEVAKKLKVQIGLSLTSINTIPIPFDFALTKENVGENGPIMTSVLSLQKQGDLIAQGAKELGFTISTDLPQ